MIVIGIAGGTGSGKTTVVNKILHTLPKGKVAVLGQDSYYKDNSTIPLAERTKINYDHPRAIDFDLLIQHLKDLKEGKNIEQPVYSYITHSRTEDYIVVHPKDVVIVEGILVFTNEALRDLCDIKVFVNADSDERLLRRLKRDIQERGRDVDEVLNRYETTLKPMHEQFIEPTMKYADIIVPIGGDNHVAIDVIASMIKDKLRKDKN